VVLLLTVVLLLMVVLMIRPTQTAPETVPMPTAPLVWRGLLARQALLLLAMFLQTHLGERLVWVAGWWWWNQVGPPLNFGVGVHALQSRHLERAASLGMGMVRN